MKKLTLIVLALILVNFIGYSQVSKDKIIIDFTGNYNESYYGSGVITSNSGGKLKSLSTQLLIGYALGESFVLGVGFEYGHIKDTRNSSIINPESFAIKEDMKLKSSIYAPSLYLRYYKPIFEKFYFNLNLTTSYGFVESEYESYFFSYIPINSGSLYEIENSPENAAAYLQTENQSSDYLSFTLQPEIQYFLSRRFGFVLNFGGFRYTNFDHGVNEWNFSLKPSNWNYGIVFSLGKDK